MGSRLIRPIFLIMPVLAVLAAILGLIAVAGSSGTIVAQDQGPAPFTHRAPLDPYRINQPPDFMVRSRARTDVVMQRLVVPPGDGAWHTHLGPSFLIVTQGQFKLTRFTEKDGCIETEVFGPAEERQALFEVANEVHRPTVLGTEDAVVYITRFNIPVGGAITIPAEDPGCNPTSRGEAGSSDSTNYGEVADTTIKRGFDTLAEEREFNRYDLVIERLENQIDSMLAEAALDPSRNTPSLSREIERLDYQIDMIELHTRRNNSVGRLPSNYPVACEGGGYALRHELFGEAWQNLLGRPPSSEPTACEIDQYALRQELEESLYNEMWKEQKSR
ncbi:MAG TPA: hypothetical protein VFA32_21110 [Dehalococcoidia bacterium]|nr:hypothetical protein [Dehalococcoidia bacterium]